MKALRTYLKTRKKALLPLFETPRKKYTTETFHQIRVEIKKLNALFDLVDSSSKKFKRKKMIAPFKIIFRQAGKVRDLQLEEANFKKNVQDNELVQYRVNLGKRLGKERMLFFSLINGKTTRQLKKKYKNTIPFLYKLNSEKISGYMLETRAKTKAFLAQHNLKTTQLHELRKLLKIYYYNQMSLSLEKQKQTTSKKNF